MLIYPALLPNVARVSDECTPASLVLRGREDNTVSCTARDPNYTLKTNPGRARRRHSVSYPRGGSHGIFRLRWPS